MKEVVVLRLGHRPGRDKRMSTHAGLVARAFNADGIIFTDYKVKKIKESLERVKREWGGDFFVEGERSWRNVIEEWKSEGGLVIHLTMYGIPIRDEISKIRGEKVLVVVGAEKVPRGVYDLADFNIAIGNQPHSEIAALALFLDRFFEGRELKKVFQDGNKLIVPSNSKKIVIDKE